MTDLEKMLTCAFINLCFIFYLTSTWRSQKKSQKRKIIETVLVIIGALFLNYQFIFLV